MRQLPSQSSARVCAVVVTFKRQELLRECLHALQGQTRPLDHILVVDNDSQDGTIGMVARAFPTVETLALPENVGGAGGFHAGMKHAYDAGFEWIWLMDDDGRAAPDCLEQLLAADNSNGVRVPVQQDQTGRFYGVGTWPHFEIDRTDDVMKAAKPVAGKWMFAFVGPLIHRDIVTQIGLPNKDFFIWFDDVEYALRIQSRTKAPVWAVPGALFAHDFGTNRREVRFLWRRSTRAYFAPWKSYYGVRNPSYVLLHQRHSHSEFYRFIAIQARHLFSELIFEPDRWLRAQMRLSGLWDGVRGKLGKRA